LEKENILKKFSKMRKKYPLQKTIFEKAFFIEKNPFSFLSKRLSLKDYNIILECKEEFL